MVFFPAENKCTAASENKDVVTHAFFREEKLGPIQMRCTRSLPCPLFPAAPTPVCVPGESEGVKEGEQILIPVVSPSGATDCNFHPARRRNDETVTQHHRGHHHLDTPQIPLLLP